MGVKGQMGKTESGHRTIISARAEWGVSHVFIKKVIAKVATVSS